MKSLMSLGEKGGGGEYGFRALELDMSKANDRVRWNFLQAILTVMKFDSKWIKWIMECVTSVHYTLLINGNLMKSFTPS